MNNMNKLYRVMCCLKLFLSHVPLLAFFYGPTALVGLGLISVAFVITCRRGLRDAPYTVVTSYFTSSNSLATKSVVTKA